MNRATLAKTALELIQEDGLDALTMRTLADRSGVKAASLYWHVRDRDELLAIVADALLARVPLPDPGREWRQAALTLCMVTAAQVAGQRDGDRILHEVPEAIRRSAVQAPLAKAVAAGGVENVNPLTRSDVGAGHDDHPRHRFGLTWCRRQGERTDG